VLEHVQNPVEFLNELCVINGKRCHFVIEVPSTDWIVRNHAFWDFTYEHVNYFTEESFQKIFNRCDVRQIFNSQYLLAIGDSNSLNHSQSLQKSEAELFAEAYSELLVVSAFIDRALTHGSQLWIWGGATKGVLILFHLLGLRPDYLSSVAGIVDINPSKQNKFCAGTGVQIISPEFFVAKLDRNDLLIIVNPNYEIEVRSYLSKVMVGKLSVFVLKSGM